ncbi:hypothetical protein I3760_08G141000 [Carya illinoinensis]|nr:hypothetical protein I3760_08G141000 [Carya illinoinensis]
MLKKLEEHIFNSSLRKCPKVPKIDAMRLMQVRYSSY